MIEDDQQKDSVALPFFRAAGEVGPVVAVSAAGAGGTGGG
jgi:hypothetical protein